MRCLLPLLLALGLVAFRPAAALEEDLASPSQEVRDKAAAVRRANYQAVPEAKWQPVVEQLKPKLTRAEVEEILRPFHAQPGMGVAGGGGSTESVQLDNDWRLTLMYQMAGPPAARDVLFDRQLEAATRSFWVAPPKGFTGTWVTYFANGQKSHEIPYRDGGYFGDFVSYHSNGQKACVQHYTERGVEGEETGFMADGKLAHRGQYKGNKPVGRWDWYNEKGDVISEEEYDDSGRPVGGNSLKDALRQLARLEREMETVLKELPGNTPEDLAKYLKEKEAWEAQRRGRAEASAREHSEQYDSTYRREYERATRERVAELQEMLRPVSY